MNQGSRKNKGMGKNGRSRGTEKAYRGNNTAQSFPDGIAVKLINPATYMGVRAADQITFTKQTSSGRICGDFMARVGDGEFAFYRACGKTEEEVRIAANEIKQKFSGSDGIKGIVDDLRKDEIAKRSELSRKQLDLENAKEQLANEENPNAKQAFSQFIGKRQREVNQLQKELSEIVADIEKYSTLDKAMRQQPTTL
jgi:hypothetical protein